MKSEMTIAKINVDLGPLMARNEMGGGHLLPSCHSIKGLLQESLEIEYPVHSAENHPDNWAGEGKFEIIFRTDCPKEEGLMNPVQASTPTIPGGKEVWGDKVFDLPKHFIEIWVDKTYEVNNSTLNELMDNGWKNNEGLKSEAFIYVKVPFWTPIENMPVSSLESVDLPKIESSVENGKLMWVNPKPWSSNQVPNFWSIRPDKGTNYMELVYKFRLVK
ncbi:hypothetical protein [Cyclobacterium plantarum]|uniref:Uncharacterized protein n=1 Tax=Cyclobacterium plantarum TaxID=2716263 RepID=A0ABX0H8M7_9BACT|nr:hypothetical protein [Cyclobacterium plantarum]NHE57972.1 hypothetical protein [Cyclobacterium plantarum]